MIGAIASGAQALLGIGQMVGGLFMEKPEIPEYDIPDELYANMTDAEYWSFKGMPDAQRQQFIEQSQRAGASAISASASRKGGMGMISSVAQQQQDAATELLVQDSQARMKNLQNFWDARKTIAGAKDFKYEADLGKAMEERGRRDEMLGAGMQNLALAGSTIGGLAEEGGLKGLFGGGEGKLGRQTKRADKKFARTEKSVEKSMSTMLDDLTW